MEGRFKAHKLFFLTKSDGKTEVALTTTKYTKCVFLSLHYMYNVPFKYTEIHINLQFLFSQVISDLRFKTTSAISGFYLRVNTVDRLFKPCLDSVYESHRLTNF